MADETIASSVRVDGSIVYRTKRQFVEGNLDKVLNEEPRPGASRKLPGKEEALLVATACSSPPEGRAPPDDRVAGLGDGAVDRSRRPAARDGTSEPSRKVKQIMAPEHWERACGQRPVRHPQGNWPRQPR